MPASFGRPITAMGTSNNTLMPSRRAFKQHGQSGIWVSDWYPNIAEHVDDMAVIRSVTADGLNHVGSVCQMNTGDILAGRPALGAWTTYGLGTPNQNLPAFVIMADGADPVGGPKNWSAGFLPATFEGTQFRTDGTPIFHLTPPRTIGEKQQRNKLDLLAELNRHFAADKPDDAELAARLNSYELAYRMQAAAPEAVDLSKETELTRNLYGLAEDTTVVGAGQLRRTPFNEKCKGRDHNPWGFTLWMAGGGVKRGMVYGATDEIGLRAVEGRAHVHDIHATILHLLGMEHQRLTFLHNGRDERPTINGGEVISEVLA